MQSGDFAAPYDPPIEPVYPLENAALFFAAGGWNLVRGVYGIGRVAVTQLGRAVALRWAFSAAERAIIREATSILTSSEFAALRAAHAAGQSLTVNIGGRVVQYEAGWAYAEGMSLAEINGFLLGPRAFASPAELARTVAHELYRLQSGTLGYAEAGAYATRTTQAAFEFAQRAAPYLPGVP